MHRGQGRNSNSYHDLCPYTFLYSLFYLHTKKLKFGQGPHKIFLSPDPGLEAGSLCVDEETSDNSKITVVQTKNHELILS